MKDKKCMVLAVKCAPERKIFLKVQKAGLNAVELYLSKAIMKGMGEILKLCRDFPFRYAVHAPYDYCNFDDLASSKYSRFYFYGGGYFP